MLRKPREEIRVVLCLFFILFLGVADNQIVSPLLPAIRAQIGKSSHEAGYLFTGYSIAASISVLVWGPLSDVFGRKRGLLAGLVIFALGSVVVFLSGGYALLMSGRVITGMGASMLSVNTISYAADYFPYATRGWAMGSIFSSYFAALILGVPLGSVVGDALGWNSVFGFSAAAALLLLAATAVFLPYASVHSRPNTGHRFLSSQIRTYLGFLNSRGTLGALLSSFFASAGTMGFLAFVGVWLHDDFGVSGGRAGLVFLAAGAAALLASPFAGSLSDRIGKRVQFVLSNLALAMLLLVLPRLGWGTPLFLVFGGVSLASAFRQGPMEALITEVVLSTQRGSFVALKNSFSQMGIGLAALVSGMLFESSGYSAICSLCAILTLASALSMIFLVRQEHL